jgi:DsbC/DsbD-like thiol-disulfide interchange protein
MKRFFTGLTMIGLTVIAATLPAAAQSLYGQKTDYAAVTLHSGVEGKGGARVGVLRMELKQGWKTYWRIPGDSGVPPHFDWTGSQNLRSATTTWTVPDVFEAYGDRTIGYKTRMVVPLTLTPEDPTQPIRIRLNFTYGVCADICIPAGQEFALDIPPGAPEDGAYFIERAMAERLGRAPEGAVRQARCEIVAQDGETRLYVSLQLTEPFARAPTIIGEATGATIGRFDAQLRQGGVIAVARIAASEGAWIDRSSLRLTVLGEGRGMVIHGCGGA